MGTNYYVADKSKYCEHCGRGEKTVHLGKSSAGWCFTLNVHPKRDIHNWKDILKFVKGKKIFNEYGEHITLPEFVDVVEKRKRPSPISKKNFSRSTYYTSLGEFLEVNNAELGPNNLLRHRIGDFCIGHGEGTYDYVVGDFS